MSPPTPLEDALLTAVEAEIACALAEVNADDKHSNRLELLEAVACRLAGIGLADYRAVGDLTKRLPTDSLEAVAPGVVAALTNTPIPPALALAALAREPRSHYERRKAGSYYTDFRLARFLAARAVELRPLKRGEHVIDPASGTGILLVAVALAAYGDNRTRLDSFVRDVACAGDLSSAALRGLRLSLTALARDVASVAALSERLRQSDSLVAGGEAWRDVAPQGFGLVIGNPPWEKLKISRHEHLTALGAPRHYGDDYGAHLGLDDLHKVRAELADYVQALEYDLAGKGEPDLYRLFLALSSALVRDGGQIAMLVPAGLIRSEGTGSLREHLISSAPELRFAVLDNKARFFAIDTRFKFLALNAILDATAPKTPILLEHATGTDNAVIRTGRAHIGRRQLAAIRRDLSIPEVRSDAEWRLFHRLSEEGVSLADPEGPWRLRFSREVDMTKDRHLFKRARSNGELALIEGRMVHQFRHTAKAHISGTGRRAEWGWQALGERALRPQFFVDAKRLRKAVRERAQRRRVGFCDITGQTNERSMLAASIPAGVACGNKVPTITFEEMGYDENFAAGVFLAVLNSFAFDWLLRRVITTTVNYFLLLSVPFPSLDLDGARAARLAELAREADAGVRTTGSIGRELSSVRAEMDALVIEAYRLSQAEVELVLDDFPLLDRGQPAIRGERRSTITRDRVLLEVARRREVADDNLAARFAEAVEAGAEAYVPSQLARSFGSARDLAVA